ncbi:cytochrome b/b6 domain-containing protein [Pseudoalteromonas sp. SG45-5]|uniref:cytochrome b/b6 domain-containing protein n=1 Tax=unclassified Pseudoalteromonas TaxID=194690 RepID=UPI0015F8A327|nr:MULTISPECIES: cytochrome b/b6 domain-containing protein [unclassified Pseudoalteromonas]MBB1386129.1 cytochrome b/b6 domain-containing protein [Pseudoalteromonas sp. SG45-5]MBB1394039.1 cytochrome b/b6 domain-containing protein [Pseudoalteromonas sp. SG44-4]MBB1448937.1 cytochrome b/b6 domain-containing protein [Pseudoalteromonas sp. SG41-6]
MTTLKVWDGFIRCFHWFLVVSIAVLYFSIEEGMIELHFIAGFFTLALIATRLIWGVIGSRTAKLSALIHSPRAVFNSFKSSKNTIGHSAPGSYMVLVFFALIITQLVTGLMSSDGILTDGPLVEYVSSDTVDFANWLHHLNFDILLYAIGLHVLAIIFYRIKGKPLVKAMITGSKNLKEDEPHTIVTKSPWLAWGIFFILLFILMMTWGKEPINYLFS